MILCGTDGQFVVRSCATREHGISLSLEIAICGMGSLSLVVVAPKQFSIILEACSMTKLYPRAIVGVSLVPAPSAHDVGSRELGLVVLL